MIKTPAAVWPPGLVSLFPLDSAGGLGGDVEGDAVDARYLVDDSAGDGFQQFVGQTRPVGGHGVLAGDGADDDRVGVGALVPLDADAADARQDAERLPQLTVEPGAADLLLEDEVGFPQDLQALLGDFTDDADGEPRSRERLAPDHVVRQAQLRGHVADLVLEDVPQRLDQVEVHVLRQPADVVVGLDLGGVAGAALDDVGIKGALHQEAGAFQLARLFLEDADELLADDLALLLRLTDARQLLLEAFLGLDVDQRHVEVVLEGVDHLLGLVLPEQAVVHEDAGEVILDGAVHQQRRGR